MFKFDFFNVKIKKERTIQKSNIADGKYSILEKNIYGIVHIDLEANYYVKICNKNYPIISENYDTKNIPEIFAQELDKNGHRKLIIRNNSNLQKLPVQYLPFAPGIKVCGNIVLNNYNKLTMFKIKKIEYDEHTKEGLEALKFYKENYNVIQSILKDKWNH